MKTEPEFSPENQERITRWIDGELGDDAVADLLSAHPELAEEKNRAHQLGDLLHRELAPEREAEVPYADFFSHRVRQRILEDEEEEENASVSTTATLKDEATYLPLFTRMRYAAGIAFVAMLVGIVGYNLITSPSAIGSEVVSTYTPDPAVTATTRYDSEAKATVIELEGLEEIPVETSIAGVFPGSYQPCGDFGRTILTDPANGHPLLALAIDSSGRPEITALKF